MKYSKTARRLSEALNTNNMRAQDLANATGINKASISQYVNGSHSPSNISAGKMASVLNVSPLWLMGFDVPRDVNPAAARSPESYGLARFSDVHKKAIPLLGTVACGAPIYANEEHDSYVLADEDIDADYCLTARGDSMINARIYDGDLIFVKQCDHVENGEIAVVAIHDEVTLKRVYFYPETHTLQLIAENPKYPPLIYHDEELDGVYVIGKALFFQALIRS